MNEPRIGEVNGIYRDCRYRYSTEFLDDMSEVHGVHDIDTLCRRQIDLFLKVGSEPGFRLRLKVSREPVVKDGVLESHTITLNFTKVYE